MAKKSGLGKGLDALFLDNETAESSSLMTLRVSDIEPNKDQPRKAFEPNALAELADSIREHGILQPVVVRALPGGVYQIIAGERRWRASRMAGLSEIPAIVIEADDAKVRELALIENLQRQDLTPLEEAEGYRSLMEHSGMTQEEVAARLGKSRCGGQCPAPAEPAEGRKNAAGRGLFDGGTCPAAGQPAGGRRDPVGQ